MAFSSDISPAGCVIAEYRPFYADLARILWLGHKVTEEGLAERLGVTLADIAWWAWDHEEFFNAITPTDEETAAFKAAKDAKSAKRSARAKKHYYAKPSNRIVAATRSRMWAALKGRSDGKLFSRLGYSAEELVAHLESRFQEGMGWHNYGKWHVDHEKPCAAFDLTDPVQFAECWALANLQPLWARDNMLKSAKYAGP